MNSETAPRIRRFPDPQALGQATAESFQEMARDAEQAGRLLHVALSGGNTPRAMFKALARPRMRLGIPWRLVHLYWADERCVPPDHPESNYGAAFAQCLKYVPIPRENVHRIPGEEAPERACRLYAEILRRHLPAGGGGRPQLDWVILGMGADGHTASLFPGRPWEAEGPCLLAHHPDTGQARVSLTLSTLLAARRVTVQVTGGNKAETLATVLQGQAPDLPAAHLQGPHIEWWLDDAAAGLLDTAGSG